MVRRWPVWGRSTHILRSHPYSDRSVGHTLYWLHALANGLTL